MFDLGWSELLLIGIVALIVVGPKDLPRMFRELGRFTGKARAMARDFTRAMNAAADEAGVKDLDRTLRTAANPMRSATNAVRDAVSLKDTDDKGSKGSTSGAKTTKPAKDAPPPDEAAADAGISDEPSPAPAPTPAPEPAPKPAAEPAAAASGDGTAT